MEKNMYYGNSKNTTSTQSTYNCNAAVGFFMALLLGNFTLRLLNLIENGILWAL